MRLSGTAADRTGRLQPSKIIVGLRTVGVDFQCLATRRRGFDKLALIDQDGAEVVVCAFASCGLISNAL